MGDHRTAHALLTAARARIAAPGHWTQNVYARDPGGSRVLAESSLARRWCAYGALQAEGGNEHSDAARLLRLAARDVHGVSSVVDVNDELGHPAVLQMYDRAIVLAAEEEAC